MGIPQFSSKITPTKIVSFILEQSWCWMNISLNFTIRASWTWRGLKTIHLPFLRKSVRCTVCSSRNATYLKDCRDIFGVWIDIANNIKFNKQVSTSVASPLACLSCEYVSRYLPNGELARRLYNTWCSRKRKATTQEISTGTRDCGRSKIAWKGGLLFYPLANHLANPGFHIPYKQSLGVQRTIEDY